jgi:hypothetical protein
MNGTQGDDPHWNIVELFDIDSGELNGLDPQHCFCLGVEFAIWRQRLKDGKQFTSMCLSKNAERLVAMAERHGRFAEHHPTEMPGFTTVTIGGQR